MITIHSQPASSSLGENKNKSQLTLKKDILFYKITCLCYLILVIVLLTFFIIRAFKYKYYKQEECYMSSWIDTVITIVTLTIVVLASCLVVASLKYVFASEDNGERNEPSPVDRVEDFIRRNSQAPLEASVARNPSIGSNWLSAVRTEAYETHRRMSMAAPTVNKVN